MGFFWHGCGAAFGLGFVYFVAAIPAGVGLGVPVWLAVILVWAGYSSGAVAIALAGQPLRRWVAVRFGFSIRRDPSKWVWKVWDRAGLAGLALMAPVTVGPQFGSLIALAMGESAFRVMVFFSLGVVPWCVGFGVLTSAGVHLSR
jgi:hypothetical protein